MDKIKNIFSTTITVLTKVLGLAFCVVALQFLSEGDRFTALISLFMGAGLYFIPDLIKKKNQNNI